jgi:multicomponent Na+:H+ antiporter subunit E
MIMCKNNVPLFLMLVLVWLLLMWPCGWIDAAAGLAVAALAVYALRVRAPENCGSGPACPLRLGWGVVYMVVLAWYVLKANFDVAYRVMHPEMPINPGIVKIRTALKSPAGITALANSITLTPGTLTVQAEPDGTLYVHWIDVKTTDPEEAHDLIVRRLESLLKRVFE